MSKLSKELKADKLEQNESEIVGDQIDSILNEKEYKGLHYGSRSGVEIVKPEIIDTGSFLFNHQIGGGFRGGWSRFSSEPEHGKTSQGLLWGANWQKYWKTKNKNGFVVIFNAEGRTTRDLIDRSKIDTSKEHFRIVDTNNADFIYDFCERLIINNPEKRMYFFLLDSTDACQRSIDRGKGFADADKIAGGAAIISAAGKRLSLLFSLKQHHLYLCSQLRDKMTTGPGGGGGKAPSGGWGPQFYSSLTGRIQKHWSDFSILENPSDKKSKEIGRLAQIKLEKTYNESSGKTVLVPILYEHGIWKEYEAMMIADSWKFVVEVKQGRYEFTESFAQELTENKIGFEPKFHGMKNMREHFTSNQDLVHYIFDKMTSIGEI